MAYTSIRSWHLRLSVMVPRGTWSSPPKGQVMNATACHILGKAVGCTGQSEYLSRIWRGKKRPIHTSRYQIISQSYYLINIFTLEVGRAWKDPPFMKVKKKSHCWGTFWMNEMLRHVYTFHSIWFPHQIGVSPHHNSHLLDSYSKLQ